MHKFQCNAWPARARAPCQKTVGGFGHRSLDERGGMSWPLWMGFVFKVSTVSLQPWMGFGYCVVTQTNLHSKRQSTTARQVIFEHGRLQEAFVNASAPRQKNMRLAAPRRLVLPAVCIQSFQLCGTHDQIWGAQLSTSTSKTILR